MSTQTTLVQFLINFIIILTFSLFIFLNTNAFDWNTRKDLSFTDSLYVCLTSLSSVGYGDITPLSKKAKYILIFIQLIVLLEILSIFEYIKNDTFNISFVFKILLSLVFIILLSLYFTYMTDDADWNLSNNNSVNFVDMTYFSSTTLTTCGHGDITPLTLKSKIPVMITQAFIIYQIISLIT